MKRCEMKKKRTWHRGQIVIGNICVLQRENHKFLMDIFAELCKKEDAVLVFVEKVLLGRNKKLCKKKKIDDKILF